jgi:SP family sugar:H+ symporter-like MFS transporter
VTFSLPYLLNAPYANLQSKVGFIFGSIAGLSLFFAYFFVPDCQGRTLEEVDWLFENKIAVRKFSKTPLNLQEEASKRVQEKGQVNGKIEEL